MTSITIQQIDKFDQLSHSRTAPLQEVQRAKILLHYAENIPILQIQKQVNASRPTIYKCIDKALAVSADTGLKDYYYRHFELTIDDSANVGNKYGLHAEILILT